MFRLDSGSLSRVAVILGICATAAVLACATSQSTDEFDSSDGVAVVETQELANVAVDKIDDQTVITLWGLEDPDYTVHRVDGENVLVMELPGVSQRSGSLIDAASESDNQISVYDGLVDQVSTSTYIGENHPITRVEISFAVVADYEIISGRDGLEVWLRPASEMADLADEGSMDADEDPWAVAESMDEPGDGDAVNADDDSRPKMPMAAANAAPASTLMAVLITPTEFGTLLYLEADGVLMSAETFTLENPDRLVVDLPDIVNSVEQVKISVNSEWVERVRIGSHPHKLRVVLDGGPKSDKFQGRRLIPATNGLFMTVGTGNDLDDALAEALMAANGPLMIAESIGEGEDPDTGGMIMDEASADGMDEAEAEPEIVADVTPMVEEPAQIYGLQYDRNAERDRIAVLSDRVIEYEMHQPDSETVVISILNSVLSESVGERITPELGGPVSLVTTFMQPDLEHDEVRVVMRRAPDLEPTLMRRGSLLFVDFENTGVAAAPPPAFIPGESEGAAGAQYANKMQITEPESTEPASIADAVEDSATTEPQAEGVGSVVAMGENSEKAATAEIDTPFAALPNISDPDSNVTSQKIEDDWKDAAAMDPGPSPAALEPPAAVDILEEGGLIDGKEYVGRRISLDFKKVAIADVLRLIAEVSDLNIIAGDEVAGQITIRLVDVPWDQALDVILLTKGLGFVRVGNVLRIAPAEILKVEEEVRLQERRNREKLEDLEVKLHPVNYASVTEAASLVKRLLSPRGTVNTDKRTNTLIIKDISSVIDEAVALLQAIDTQTPQVMIEAKIVEASLEFGRELGSTWAVGTQPFNDAFNPGAQNQNFNLGTENFKFQGANNVIVGNPITSGATGLINFGAFLLDDQMQIDVQIQAMEKSGEGKVISSPRIVTLDNRTAIIEQGVSIPFQTFEGGDAKLEFIDAVLSLKVTPHITSDESIIMKIEVTRNAPDNSVSTPTGSPAIAKNQAKTETLVKNGQTLVIGGIYTIDKTQRESRVPYLHKLPILGAAFKSRSISDIRKELLIFVTPRIVVNPELASK